MRPSRRTLLILILIPIAMLVAGLVALAAVAFAGGFDKTTTDRVSGGGTHVVRVALVDDTLGFDVEPDVITVDPGTHLVLDVVNEGDEKHNLAVDGGSARTRMLQPGESQRLDLGRIEGEVDSWCTLPGHKLFGMELDIRTTGAAAS